MMRGATGSGRPSQVATLARTGATGTAPWRIDFSATPEISTAM